MPPHSAIVTGVLDAEDAEINSKTLPEDAKIPGERKLEIVWTNVILIAFFHLCALYAFISIFISAKLASTAFAILIMYPVGGLGITVSAHRLWAHKSYKATLPLRILLTFFNTTIFQNSVIVWARDHRMHHKYADTDADPHNSTRGFFFAHCGWLMCKKHQEVKNKGKTIDVSDLWADPVLRFQHKYYFYLMPFFAFVLPTAIPMYFWQETFINSFCLNMLRFVMVLNFTWAVNSASHLWGYRPYDKYIHPVDNAVVDFVTLGDGWHNFHHIFPWDYKAAELGRISLNLSTNFINFMAKIGWAYDLKTASPQMIRTRAKRTGDGSRDVWGWGDEDQPGNDATEAVITHKKDA